MSGPLALHGLSGKRLEQAILRYRTMQKYETKAANAGYVHVAGIDEAGRGPLAGPVVACACILDRVKPIYGLNDSKKISPKNRAALFDLIRTGSLAYAIGVVDAAEIDRINILNATKRAMQVAVAGLSIRPDCLLVDAVELPEAGIPAQSLMKGDLLSNSIAAASILAKVTRDRMMEEWNRTWPVYGFARHKGYGTAEHIAALRQWGPSPIHRLTFLRSIFPSI